MKKLLLATAFAASLATGIPATAEAHKVGIVFYLGYPHYGYRVGPGYIYRPGYGWYWPGYRAKARLSCGEARWRVRSHGYHNVSTIECNGMTYTFRGTRNGYRVVLFVNARTGAMWRG